MDFERIFFAMGVIASLMFTRTIGEEEAPTYGTPPPPPPTSGIPTDPLSPTCHIPAIYNFGDSNSDTGGIAAAFYQMQAPCGETFFHRPAGRASDGRLIIDFIAEQLGLPHLSAYLDSIKSSYTHGANFATGGATIRRINESWFLHDVSPFSLDIQIVQFDQFKLRTAYFYNLSIQDSGKSRLPRPDDFGKAIYVIDIGQNDIADGFRILGIGHTRSIIPDMVNNISDSVQQLYGKGARAFWIHNTGPIGCLPQAVAKVQDPKPGDLDKNGCLKVSNNIAKEFNKQLKKKVIQLRSQLSKAVITYVDMYAAKYQLISKAKDQGFQDPMTICCGYHNAKVDLWCGSRGKINGSEVFAGSCKDPSTVISWDGVHYTEAANHWIANLIVNGSLSDPPISISQTCPKS